MTTDDLKLVRIGNATSEMKMTKQRNGVLKNRDAVVVVNSIAPIKIACNHHASHSMFVQRIYFAKELNSSHPLS